MSNSVDSGTWLGRVGNTLLDHFLDHVENKVFRFALLTVLLVSAVQQFVGWKYAGVVIREVVAHVQRQVLPWGGPTGPSQWLVPPSTKVATLLIGDEWFADEEGFGHRVPLPPDRVLRLLSAVVALVPEQARIVIDFDLAPRVGEDPTPRVELDNWLAANAHRLLLVEPTWAARHAETLKRQLEWAWRMCRVDPRRATHAKANDFYGAMFVQSTLTSHFGFVTDALPLSGERGPAWDIGRAVDDLVNVDPRWRNPICSRLLGDSPAPGGEATAGPRDALTLQLLLGQELRRHGTLRIDPQPADPKGRDAEVLLRSEFIRADPACEPKNFEEVSSLPCLPAASVVVIGGAWSHGLGDLQDTFVGEADGAVVHAAWIQSWLKPARHLNKALDILLDVVIIESLLHPMLKFAFVGMRRRSEIYLQQVKSVTPTRGLGRHVTAMLLHLALAVVSVVGTAFALIVVDGVLRWVFDRSLALDTTILALVIWSAIALNGIGSPSQERVRAQREAFPVINAAWLAALCAGSLALAGAVWKLSHWHPAAVQTLVWIGLALIPIGFAASALYSHAEPKEGPHANASVRWSALRTRLHVLWGSISRSLDLFGWYDTAPTGGWPLRLADALGAVMWLAVWAYGIYVLARSTLWGLVLEFLKG